MFTGDSDDIVSKMSFKFLLAEFQTKPEEKGWHLYHGGSDPIIYDHDLLDILRGEPSASRRSSIKAHLTWKDDERIVIVLGFLRGMER